MQYYASLIFIFEFRLSSRPIVVVSQSREVFFSIVVGSVLSRVELSERVFMFSWL